MKYVNTHQHYKLKNSTFTRKHLNVREDEPSDFCPFSLESPSGKNLTRCHVNVTIILFLCLLLSGLFHQTNIRWCLCGKKKITLVPVQLWGCNEDTRSLQSMSHCDESLQVSGEAGYARNTKYTLQSPCLFLVLLLQYQLLLKKQVVRLSV